MSTFDRSPEDETWYVHAPLKKEKRPIVLAPPPSNIPYLNGVMDDEKELSSKRPAIWFKETDSDFIKLSKLGGREDLLVHRTKERTKEPVPYPRPAWWVDMLTELNKPNDKKETEKPYVFEVPAWFAHQDKIKINSNNNSNNQQQQHYYEQQNQRNKHFDYKYEAIEEPLKYGQLRNYLHPVKVKPTNPNAFDSRMLPPPQRYDVAGSDTALNMHKLIGNYYSNDRPANYQEWK